MPKRGKLELHVWSMFTVEEDVDKHGRRKVRWTGRKDDPSEPTAENTIKDATVAVLDETNVPTRATDQDGRVTLDLSSLRDGMYTLRLRPHADQETNEPAGVLLDPPATITRMYRPLDVRIRWQNGALASPPPAILLKDAGPAHGAVVAWDARLLTLDWKPEFVRAKHIKVRAAVAKKKLAQEEARKKRSKTKSKGPNFEVKMPTSVNLPDEPVRAVVLHRTFTPTIGPVLNRFLTDTANAHYVIDVDGFVVKLVHERDEASHAGEFAQWHGMTPLNACSVGIEMVNEKGPMADAQMKSLIALLKALIKAYDIPKENVVGHFEVKPLKKDANVTNERIDCPGAEFDWQRLEREKVAATLYPQKPGGMQSLLRAYPYFLKYPTEPLERGDSDKAQPRIYGKKKRTEVEFKRTIWNMQLLLRNLGYDLPTDEVTASKCPFALPIQHQYDKATGRVVERFKMRYLAIRNDEPNKPPLNDKELKLDRVTAYTILRAYNRDK